MSNAFEYGLLPQSEMGLQLRSDRISRISILQRSVWWSSLTKFSKLVVSSRLQPLLELEPPVSNTGLLSDIWSTIATDSNKKIFNMFTDEIGKTPPIGRRQVCHPSILNWADHDSPRTLLTPSMRSSTSKSSIQTDSSSPTKTTTEPSSPLVATSPTSTLSVDMAALALKDVAASEETGDIPPMQMVHGVNVDDTKEDEDEDEDWTKIRMMTESWMKSMQAHDSGLTDEDKKVANDLLMRNL
ncbi:hypothetical protein M378DRAFT_12724 [Amanita muscaria Koide BX008]|uniref:Uncharacterized protein n=1 Tax=Amanita muscaria (strain Koide BX008) TaxID=946122 RepID=A0A0C2X0L0_AMAMK|nr:hypothetical protein M378DRAFT_12724 [Amanita muscaria Koide BX008]